MERASVMFSLKTLTTNFSFGLPVQLAKTFAILPFFNLKIFSSSWFFFRVAISNSLIESLA
jgi:hypothetical protein